MEKVYTGNPYSRPKNWSFGDYSPIGDAMMMKPPIKHILA
jgi:hypothetical protein